MNNKLFASNEALKGQTMVSKVRTNREYLLSSYTAGELNTYVSFEPFKTFNDAYQSEYDANGQEIIDGKSGPGALGVRSIFNKMGAVMIGGNTQKKSEDIITQKASEWRISNNVPLMDNRETRRAIRKHSGCSIRELVQASENGYLGRETYSYSDFMYCKHLGKVSNNYLITLRRFPLPVDDYIATLGEGNTRSDKDIASQNAQSIGCLVTWMGTPGNEMSNILKYSFKMPFKQQKAQFEDAQLDADSGGGIANSVAAIFDSKYRAQYQAGHGGAAANKLLSRFFPVENGPYSASQWSSFKDSTKVYGPVDAIKDIYSRSEEGLSFEQNITITFDYELRSYNGINGRQAMLDLLSNILNVTYTTGTFWGGGYRGYGMHQNNMFANLNIFKANGGFTDFVDKFAMDITDATKGFQSMFNSKYGGNWWSMLKAAMNQLGGMLIGGMLNNFGRPQKQLVNSLLSPAPVGFWHLTVGNPHHPIMSLGNMILKNTTIEHYGPLGLDDFPTGIRVTCELERGKSRDIRDIEKIYMHGNDRIYTSMGPKVFDMYEHSKEYKDKNGYKHAATRTGDANASVVVGEGEGATTIEIQDIQKMSHILQKYFGHVDTYSIYVSACEQEMGAHKKKKKGAGAGDSSQQGGTNRIS